MRALAEELRVSPATVAAAYRHLRTRGLVAGQGRRGTRVVGGPPLPVRGQPPLPVGVRDLANGNPDPALLPSFPPLTVRSRLYGEPAKLPELLELAQAQLEADGIDPHALAIVGGALDGIERVLQARLHPGDRVAVEDPGFVRVLDLVSALGLVPVPVLVDDEGPEPGSLRAALVSGVDALVVTPRAQNPTGAALGAARADELSRLLREHADVLVIEDDHAALVAGAPAVSLTHGLARWAVARSLSKAFGPDLRLAIVAGDEATIARVEGRQRLGTGWVSHVLQHTAASLLADLAPVERAARVYAERRTALLEALAARGISAHGRSGMNVWIPVAEEAPVLGTMLAAGWGLAAGERYRLASRPGVRVTISTLGVEEASALAANLEAALTPYSGFTPLS